MGYLTAVAKDLADVQEIAKAWKLTPAYARKLPEPIRPAFLKAVKPLGPPPAPTKRTKEK
ncbi:hypothetical protein QQ056_16935 [Oscillatoria laete-virens NRMC-F 0139]|nr:hypothetical protein [Oscillatoria laete-virens]MDL5055219.1 hypothetical protein [Oscillatoria laete-virens NRMC-F 0139]